jgi:hypothetical protein
MQNEEAGLVAQFSSSRCYGDCSPELCPRTVASVADGLHVPGRKRASNSVSEVHQYNRRRNRYEREIGVFGAHQNSKKSPTTVEDQRA